jgi:hypothetical protein
VCRHPRIITRDGASTNGYIPHIGKTLFERLTLLYQHLSLRVEYTYMNDYPISTFRLFITAVNRFIQLDAIKIIQIMNFHQ